MGHVCASIIWNSRPPWLSPHFYRFTITVMRITRFMARITRADMVKKVLKCMAKKWRIYWDQCSFIFQGQPEVRKVPKHRKFKSEFQLDRRRICENFGEPVLLFVAHSKRNESAYLNSKNSIRRGAPFKGESTVPNSNRRSVGQRIYSHSMQVTCYVRWTKFYRTGNAALKMNFKKICKNLIGTIRGWVFRAKWPENYPPSSIFCVEDIKKAAHNLVPCRQFEDCV